jgi:outer membrane lipoprotein-sorting protein
MRRLPLLLVTAGVALLMPSCAPKPVELVLDTAQVSPARIAELIGEHDARLHSLAGGGTLTFESPELSGSVFFTVSVKKPDSLLLRFEGPFGMDVGFLFASRERYVMYNALENHVIRGIPTAAGIRSVIPFDLTFDQLLDMLTGTFRLPPGTTAPQTYRVDDEWFHLVYPRPGDTTAYWIDPRYATVAKYRVTGPEGTLMEAETSMPEQQGELTAPRLVSVTFPETRRQVSIYYSDLTLNPGVLAFTYTIPPSARTRVPK